MRTRWGVMGMLVAIFGLIVIAGFGAAVHQLWNLLMPDIFGLRPIGFWQAVGLLGLSWLLFGGFGWFGMRPMRGRSMTPEQRSRFRAGLRGKCGDEGTAKEQGV